ncbi:ras-related and estrogen-regulated growth inhibitor isoform X2 [Paramormyrops kingsleyae]|uniref:ras-related and estrogen-regulated growth inhibitor isoform X2 n=1 Tax=Paramormyrops kingsleyae TaxID=1676925 RepID=UPI000CD5F22F|nr:ras-related and estrogen-regulated growth inhibitor-like isoform X2 [Paramormyrops kingsleyae]
MGLTITPFFLQPDNCEPLTSTYKTTYSLCVRFITKRFIGEYDHKKEVTYKCQRVVDKEAIDLEILDTVSKCSGPTAGTLESYIKWGDGFLIMYSVTDRSTFQCISNLKRQIDHFKQTFGTPIAIVANKSDMENGRAVRTEEGQALANELRCTFYELSVAEDWTVVDSAMTQLVLEVKLAFHKQQLAMEKRSRMLQVGYALKNKLTRSKTMQW